MKKKKKKAEIFETGEDFMSRACSFEHRKSEGSGEDNC
jgi:hypothetical protein